MSDDPDHVNRGSVYKKLVLFNRVFSVTPAVTIIGKKLMRIPFVFLHKAVLGVCKAHQELDDNRCTLGAGSPDINIISMRPLNVGLSCLWVTRRINTVVI